MNLEASCPKQSVLLVEKLNEILFLDIQQKVEKVSEKVLKKNTLSTQLKKNTLLWPQQCVGNTF